METLLDNALKPLHVLKAFKSLFAPNINILLHYDNFLMVWKKKTLFKNRCTIIVMWTVLPGINLSGREAHHSLPHRIEVKNQWRYTSIPPTRLRDVCADKFMFLYCYKFKFLIQNLV